MPCPVCRNIEVHLLQVLCQNAQVLGSCFPPHKVTACTCPHCGMIYLQSDIPQSSYTEYYRTIAKSPVYYELFGKKESDSYFAHIYEILKDFLPCGRKKVLDVAGSWGELGAYLANADGKMQVTVLEVNDRCLKVCANKGLRTFKADIAAPIDQDEEYFYDAIILNHTLEHIVDLNATMLNIRHMLKDDGVVYVELPNAAQYSMENTSPFFFATLEHVAHFTAESLLNLASMCGFEVASQGTYYKRVSRYPSIWAVLKKNLSPLDRISITSTKKNNGIATYLEQSASALQEQLSIYEFSQQKLILWGIGASTVLYLNAFEKCNVVALVDTNEQKQGAKYLLGERMLHIDSPAIIAERPEADIFVLSEVYKDVIKQQIREMGFSNRVLSW